ncbi:MAG: molecular chaperone HtpG [Clostridia bacterium]|nr:molecular chaperone HtpG [Clostridia bacterium]
MEMRKFKTESQKVLDMMINSIYTHKEIFLRELLSNCSDAIDKLYYKSLTDGVSGMSREDFSIRIEIDKEHRALKVSDNGIGMTAEELENNLGVIAHSGSLEFKKETDGKAEDLNIIGQFGVGFYSAFMVAKKVEVLTKAYGAGSANLWVSNGTEGYEIKPAEKEENGTEITLYLKDDGEENYSRYLEEYEIKDLVRKYSNYIRYPIKMEVTSFGEGEEKKTEVETLNTMVPLWRKNKKDITKEEYDKFYADVFYDQEEPLLTIHTSAEGAVEYKALLFIPAHPRYDFYSKNFEKGLRLYTNGVLITDKCKDLLPDHFAFVQGLVDSELTLNVSRETVQHDRQLQRIAQSLEKKIKSELINLQKEDREKYIKFFEAFGLQIKYGIYDNWGAKKDLLSDLVMYRSVKEDKLVTLEEYVDAMAEGQKYVYYATGSSFDAIKTLPQTEKVLDAGYDVLAMTDNVDEFAVKFLDKYKEKEFRSVSGEDTGIEEDETVPEEDKEVIDFIKESLGDKVAKVKLSQKLKSHPVCLTSEGEITIEMEKVLNGMPNVPKDGVKATKVLEINAQHKIFEKAKKLYVEDKEKLRTLSTVLLNQAMLIEGLPIDSPTKYAEAVCSLLAD